MTSFRVITISAAIPLLAILSTPVGAGMATAKMCKMIDSSLDDAREQIPTKVGAATTMHALEATMERQADYCTLYARHTVDTQAAAGQLLKAAHRGGQTEATLDHAYQEMGTDRYRQAMVRLMREQVAANPLTERIRSIPGGLRKSIVMEFVYEYDPSQKVSVEPIILRLTPTDLEGFGAQ